MPPLLRIGMLVKRGTVEAAEPVWIVGEMPRHPVEDHGDAGAVAGVHQRSEIGGRAEAAGRREQAGRLVSPRAVERVLGDREEFHVREAKVAQVGGQLLGKLTIGEPAAILRVPPPGAEMHLVDRHRCRTRICTLGSRDRAWKRVEVGHDRGRLRPHLGGKGDRIGLQRQHFAVLADNLVLVMVAHLRARHEDFPKTVAAHPHGVPASIPEVEVADDAHTPGSGRENDEAHARGAFEHHRVGAELLVECGVGTLAEQVEVELAQDRREAIGILDLHLPAPEARAHPIVPRRAVLQPPGEQPGLVNALELAFVPLIVDRLHRLGVRQIDAHDRNVAFQMRPEIMEGVGVPTLDHRIGFRRQLGHHVSPSVCARIRHMPASGTRSQSGRCASSYSIS
jgi:hypothetical protein